MPETSRRGFLIGAISCGALTAAATYVLPGGRPGGAVPLRLMTGADATGGRQLLFDMWDAANRDVPLEVIVAGGSTVDQKKRMLDAAGSGDVDLLNIDIVHLQEFAALNLLSRINLSANQFLENTLDPGRTADDPNQFWAAPFNTDVGMLFERVREGTAPAQNPNLANLIDQLKPNTLEFVGQVGPGSSASNEVFVVNVLEHALSRDPGILDENNLPIDKLDRWQNALKFLREAIVDKRVLNSASEESSLDEFKKRPGPRYMRGWPVQYRELQQARDPDVLQGRISVHPLQVGILGGQSLAIVAKSGVQEQAQQLINFLTGDEAQKVLAAHGLAPTSLAAYSDGNLRAFIPHLEAIRQSVEGARIRPIHRNYAAFSTAVVDYVRPLLVRGEPLPSMFTDAIQKAFPR